MRCLTRRQCLRNVAGISLAAWWFGGSSNLLAADEDDDEEELELAEVPQAVRAAADKAVAGAKWEAAYRYKEDDELLYDLEGKDTKRRPVTVTVTAAAHVEEVETEIRLEDVPAAVKEALKAKLPRFKAKLVFELAEDGKVVAYDFEGRRPKDKEPITVSVSADAKTVEVDDD